MKGSAKRQRQDAAPEWKAERETKKCKTAQTSTLSASRTSNVAASARTTLAAPATTAAPCKNALLVVSTYHAVMAGLIYRKDKFFIKFSVKRHVGRVNGTAVTQRYIASSGVDERIFLFTNKAEERLSAAARRNMQEAGEPLAIRLADLGSITPPSEVTALAFADGSQSLLCGCSDGQLLIYRSRDWTTVATLSVHEKAVVGLAVHPGSHGSLAITAGEDRSVAVLDLVKGKLLTKWKYNPVIATSVDTTDEPAATTATTAGVAKSFFAPARAVPVGLLFSPLGTRLVVFSRFSFAVYDAATMQPLCSFQCASPQPRDEIHCCAFTSEQQLVLGVEAGVLKLFTIEGTAEKPAQVVAALANVEVRYPEALTAQAEALLAAPVKVEAEARQKNPLRHVNRVKALRVDGATIFSIDSSGIVIAWNQIADAPSLSVQYVASANCQGRVTGMELYGL